MARRREWGCSAYSTACLGICGNARTMAKKTVQFVVRARTKGRSQPTDPFQNRCSASICYHFSGHTMLLSCTLPPAFHRVFFPTVGPGYYLYESVTTWFCPVNLRVWTCQWHCRIIRRSTNINCQGALTPAMAIDVMFSSLVRGFHTLPLVRSQTWIQRESSDFDLSTCTAEVMLT